MKRLQIGIGILRPLILGILLGATLFLSERAKQWEVKQPVARQRGWLHDDLYDTPCRWCYMKVDEDGWLTTPVSNLKLKELIHTPDKEIVIPILPTVYAPNSDDALYYNTILESDIEQGDKVLVIGTGSGSDAWVASLESQSLVYAIDINPMAIANTKATARLGNFQVKPTLGDIRTIELCEDFSNCDFVLWNMPFLDKEGEIKEVNFHDGDRGSILESFLTLLPSLLNKDGQAIIFNTADALKLINFPNVTTKRSGNNAVCIIRNE